MIKGEVKKMKVAKGHEPFTYTFLVILGLMVGSKIIFNYDVGLFFVLTVIVLFLIGFVLFFHRDPDRIIPVLPDEYILSPADGKVHGIFQNGKESTIQIRMSVLNVHVNRMPMSGTIKDIQDRSGKYWPFFGPLNRGSIENARKIITVESTYGIFEIVQISGFLARRCVFYHSIGAKVDRGDKIGMIRFGSEVDLIFRFFGNEIEWLVEKGQTVKAGLTPIARLQKRTVDNNDAQ